MMDETFGQSMVKEGEDVVGVDGALGRSVPAIGTVLPVRRQRSMTRSKIPARWHPGGRRAARAGWAVDQGCVVAAASSGRRAVSDQGRK